MIGGILCCYVDAAAFWSYCLPSTFGREDVVVVLNTCVEVEQLVLLDPTKVVAAEFRVRRRKVI